MKRYIFVLTILALAFCTPQKRFDRLVKNHPELVKPDTVFVHDTTRLPAFTNDTSFLVKNFFEKIVKGDTVVIEKERVVTKIYRIRDTVRINTMLPADTIVKTIAVPFEKIEVREVTGVPWWVWLVIAGLVALLVLALRKR